MRVASSSRYAHVYGGIRAGLKRTFVSFILASTCKQFQNLKKITSNGIRYESGELDTDMNTVNGPQVKRWTNREM